MIRKLMGKEQRPWAEGGGCFLGRLWGGEECPWGQKKLSRYLAVSLCPASHLLCQENRVRNPHLQCQFPTHTDLRRGQVGGLQTSSPPKVFFSSPVLNDIVPDEPTSTPWKLRDSVSTGKKVYAFGILPADGQGMGFQRHWVLVLPDPLAGLQEEGPNGTVSCRVPWAGRPGFVTPDLKRCSGCERCWGSCLALLAAKSGPQALLPQIKNRLFFFFFYPRGPVRWAEECEGGHSRARSACREPCLEAPASPPPRPPQPRGFSCQAPRAPT